MTEKKVSKDTCFLIFIEGIAVGIIIVMILIVVLFLINFIIGLSIEGFSFMDGFQIMLIFQIMLMIPVIICCFINAYCIATLEKRRTEQCETTS